jgi:hypothetical protein
MVILDPSTEHQLFPGIMSSERTEDSQSTLTASHVGTAHGLTLANLTAYRPPGKQGSVNA